MVVWQGIGGALPLTRTWWFRVCLRICLPPVAPPWTWPGVLSRSLIWAGCCGYVPQGIGAMDEATPWYESFSELIPTVVIRDRLLAAAQKGDWSAMTMINTGVRYLVLGMPWQITKEERATLFGAPLEALLADDAEKKLAEASILSAGGKGSGRINQLQERLFARGRLLRGSDLVWLGPTGSGVPLGEVGRLTANFSSPLGQRRIVFALRSPDST